MAASPDAEQHGVRRDHIRTIGDENAPTLAGVKHLLGSIPAGLTASTWW